MRWLLLLGAEARYDRSLGAARRQLAALGELHALTAEHLTEAADGSARRYRNQLVALAHDGSREVLVEALKRVECALGRGARDGVPLDIDLLACSTGDGWQADAHALAKREFDSPHVRLLLEDAGLTRRFGAPAA
jgi:7,8-dihydro-6-hydroxymethylpterin-pyrophosphokinase